MNGSFLERKVKKGNKKKEKQVIIYTSNSEYESFLVSPIQYT
jgi:hypothetical protein